MMSYKQWELVNESFNANRTLGMKTPQNMGLMRNVPEMEEGMHWNMKHMNKFMDDMSDDDQPMLKRKRDMGGKPEADDGQEFEGSPEDSEEDDLGVDDNNDIDDVDDMDDDDEDMGDDDEMGDDEMSDDEEDDEDMDGGEDMGMDGMSMKKKKPMMMGKPHDDSSFMGEAFMDDKDQDDEDDDDEEVDVDVDMEDDDEDDDMEDEGGGCGKKPAFMMKKEGKADMKNKKKELPAFLKKGKKDEKSDDKKDKKDDMPEMKKKCGSGMKKNCKKCSKMESYLPPKKAGVDPFISDIANQYSVPKNTKFFSGMHEDYLIPAEEEIQPGDYGYAPQTRIGDANLKGLTEALSLLSARLRKMERSIERLS